MKHILKSFILCSVFLLISLVNIRNVFANAPYEASDLLGQIDRDGNIEFSTNSFDSKIPADDVVNHPYDVALDYVLHKLYVLDTGNNRVLVFNLNNSNSLIDHKADYVLGQPNFTGGGSDLNAKGFSNPQGITIDNVSHFLYVADTGNQRILVFDTSVLATNMDASYVIGADSFTTRGGGYSASRFYSVIGLAIDTSNHMLYAVINDSHRVLVFDTSVLATNMDASYVLGQPDFTTSTSDTNTKGFAYPRGAAIDITGHRLFVADYNNNRVLVFDTSSLSNNMDASYVLGQANFTTSGGGFSANKFSPTNGGPYGLVIDPTSHHLFVADQWNNRILVFDTTSISNYMDAIDLIGQYDGDGNIDFTTFLTNGIQTPNNNGFYWSGNGSGVAIDTIHHRLFVSDGGNVRIMIFDLDENNNLVDHTADYIFENGNYGGFDYQGGLAYDSVNDRLFVADMYSYCRVLVFDLSGGISNDMDASYVIGYDDFSSYDCTIGANRFGGSYYGGLAYDEDAERLYVEDTYNNYRILVFDVAPNLIHNGMDASYVIGANDFDTANGGCAQDTVDYSYGGNLAVDPNTHRLFYGNYNCYSVHVYDTSNLSNGMSASYILGYQDLDYIDLSSGQANICDPEGLAYDKTRRVLYVFDYGCYRILAFNLTDGITNGMDAIGVIGQPDFDSSDYGTSQTALSFDYVGNGAVDEVNNRLYFPDDYNNRVMIFDFVLLSTTPSLTSGTTGVSYSQTLATQFQGTTTWIVDSGSLPPGLSLTADGKLSGTPTTAGSYSFTLTVRDDNGAIGYFTDSASYTLTITQGSSGSTSSPRPEGEYSTTEAPVCNTPKPDSIPTLFQIERSYDQATIHFTPTKDNTTYYLLSYATDSTAEGHSVTIQQPDDTSGAISYRIKSLNPKTSYYFKVRNGNSCNPGVWSEVKNDSFSKSNTSFVTTSFNKSDTTGPEVNNILKKNEESTNTTQSSKQSRSIHPQNTTSSRNPLNIWYLSFFEWLKSLFVR